MKLSTMLKTMQRLLLSTLLLTALFLGWSTASHKPLLAQCFYNQTECDGACGSYYSSCYPTENIYCYMVAPIGAEVVCQNETCNYQNSPSCNQNRLGMAFSCWMAGACDDVQDSFCPCGYYW